ncbi:MAG: histidine phosphotransferase family protein, partial [Paracoccaceae bacterium]
MGINTANLAALIGSRICHDLISPIGAITNGLELMEMTGSADGPERELIADSAVNATARIRFFRIAYGLAGDQVLGAHDIQSILDSFSSGGRVRMTWDIAEDQPRSLVRLAFLALQCCETALPQGGHLQVSKESDRWVINGDGPLIAVEPGLWATLSGSQ